MLHMYLLTTRLRCLPKAEGQIWQQHLLDHFFADAENKMAVYHNMHTRGVRNKYLKDLFIQWRGLLVAYDEGVFKGDAVLASAIWRNIFKANDETDIRVLAQIVSFMRRSLQALDSLPHEVLRVAKFGSPSEEGDIVRLKSPMMDLPFQKLPGTNSKGKK
jgi:cytochrome b pre-mRNA-processing protein 3